MTPRTATAPRRTRRSWLAAVGAAVLAPVLLAGCGDDGPGSAPDQRGDRAPDPARVSTPAPLVGESADPDTTVPLPGPSNAPQGDQASGDEASEESGTETGQ